MTSHCSICALQDIAKAVSDATSETREPDKLERNQKLLFQHSNGFVTYGVCSGILARRHLLSDGRRSIVELFMKGDIIRGEHIPRFTEIIALTYCEVISFNSGTLQKIRRSSERADSAYLECIENQNCILAQHCADISKKTPPERVASFLIEYAARKQCKTLDEAEISVSMLGKDIGEYLALETETVSRSYAKLKKNGVLSLTKPGKVEVADYEKLQEIADGGMPRKRKVSLV